MPSGSRRRLDPPSRRLDLIETAERLLRDRGAAVRVEDVVREAVAAKGTFFRYFPTWYDLLEVLRERSFQAFDARLPPPAKSGGEVDWSAAIGEAATRFVDFTVELGGLHDVLFHSDFTLARPAPVHQDAAVRLGVMIRAGQQARAFADLDPEPTARLLFAVIHETADQVRSGGERSRAVAAMVVLLRRALT